ncbi:MAG TPA: STAS domain-containing protein [Nocardioidaceae bacterium]|nr:STAS domain-containing protein [Nocardioidaceae bacterium]
MTTGTPTTVRQRDGVAVIDVRGDVDSRAEEALDAAWNEALAGRPSAVALNFSDTGYINSTGIALVVGILAAARAQRLPVRAFGLSPHYLEIFEITRLADFLTISADEDTAIDDPGNTTGREHR